MALFLLNYFVLDIKEAYIPCLVVDCILLVAMRKFELRTKLVPKDAKKMEIKHQLDKKASRARKAAQRDSKKAQTLAMKKANGHASFAPKQIIQQPDKCGKLR